VSIGYLGVGDLLMRLNSSPAERKIPVVPIAPPPPPQSLAFPAAPVSSSSTTVVAPQYILHRVEVFCDRALAIGHVYDTTFVRHPSLLEYARKFWERKAQAVSGTKGTSPMLVSAFPGWVCYA
jgi:hypothetical protein